MEAFTKTIIKILTVELKMSKYHKKFYLSEVELDDGELYSLASSKPPKVGDKVEAFFNDRWGRPTAKYPKRI